MYFNSIFVAPNTVLSPNSQICINGDSFYIRPPAYTPNQWLLPATWWVDVHPYLRLGETPYMCPGGVTLEIPYPYHPLQEPSKDHHPLDLWIPKILFLALTHPDSRRPVMITEDRAIKAGLKKLRISTRQVPTIPGQGRLEDLDPFLTGSYLQDLPVVSHGFFEPLSSLRETGFIWQIWPQVGRIKTEYPASPLAIPPIFTSVSPHVPVTAVRLLSSWLTRRAPRLRNPDHPSAGVTALDTGLGLFALIPPKAVVDNWRKKNPTFFIKDVWMRNPYVPDITDPTPFRKTPILEILEFHLFETVRRMQTALLNRAQQDPYVPTIDPRVSNIQTPETVNPETVNPETVNPETVNPETVNPEISEPAPQYERVFELIPEHQNKTSPVRNRRLRSVTPSPDRILGKYLSPTQTFKEAMRTIERRKLPKTLEPSRINVGAENPDEIPVESDLDSPTLVPEPLWLDPDVD